MRRPKNTGRIGARHYTDFPYDYFKLLFNFFVRNSFIAVCLRRKTYKSFKHQGNVLFNKFKQIHFSNG